MEAAEVGKLLREAGATDGGGEPTPAGAPWKSDESAVEHTHPEPRLRPEDIYPRGRPEAPVTPFWLVVRNDPHRDAPPGTRATVDHVPVYFSRMKRKMTRPNLQIDYQGYHAGRSVAYLGYGPVNELDVRRTYGNARDYLDQLVFVERPADEAQQRFADAIVACSIAWNLAGARRDNIVGIDWLTDEGTARAAEGTMPEGAHEVRAAWTWDKSRAAFMRQDGAGYTIKRTDRGSFGAFETRGSPYATRSRATAARPRRIVDLDESSVSVEGAAGSPHTVVTGTCHVCMARTATHTYVPCGHTALCPTCAADPRADHTACIVCRTPTVLKEPMRTFPSTAS